MRPALRPTSVLVLLTLVSTACAARAGRSTSGTEDTITRADLQNPSEPIERVLERRISGITVRTSESGGLVLLIRGSSSPSGRDTPPLYILDNLPFTPGPGGAFSELNRDDIVTIKVLKGPAAAIYGIDGANGVIIISTHRGAVGRR